MYERFTQPARQTIFFAAQEAKAVRSTYIEPEHLLLGIICVGQAELGDSMPLKQVEAALRTRLHPLPPESTSIRADIPLSNVCKRCLAYAVEEAERLASGPITPGHLLLGILRQPKTLAAQMLDAHNVELNQARSIVSGLPPQRDVSLLQTEAVNLKRRFRFLSLAKLLALVVFGVILSQTSLSPKQLLWLGGIWLLVVLVWTATYRSWNIDIKTQHRRLAVGVIHVFWSAYSFLLSGWLVLIVLGAWRFFRS